MRRLTLFNPVAEGLPELGDFGCNDGSAIGLARVVEKIILMIILGGPKYWGGEHFGHDGVGPDVFRIEFANHVPGNPFLFDRVGEYD